MSQWDRLDICLRVMNINFIFPLSNPKLAFATTIQIIVLVPKIESKNKFINNFKMGHGPSLHLCQNNNNKEDAIANKDKCKDKDKNKDKNTFPEKIETNMTFAEGDDGKPQEGIAILLVYIVQYNCC